MLVTVSSERSSVITAFEGIFLSPSVFFQLIFIWPYPSATHLKCAPNGRAAVVLTGCCKICGGGAKIAQTLEFVIVILV